MKNIKSDNNPYIRPHKSNHIRELGIELLVLNYQEIEDLLRVLILLRKEELNLLVYLMIKLRVKSISL